MNQYEEAARDVEQAFIENGANVQLKVVTPGKFDPTTQTTGPETIELIDTHAMFGLITDTLARSLSGATNGGGIISGDRLIKLPASVTPKPGHFIVHEGKAYRVIDVLPTAPGGIPIMYNVQARR